MISSEDVVADTRHWLQRIVIGLGLCPFAAAPFSAGRIAYTVCETGDDEAVYQAFVKTLEGLLLAPVGEQETALLIVPQGLASFDDYLDVLEMLEQAIEHGGFAGMVQLASFHPAYCFDDAPADDPANFSNRSPFPMFHLIREAELAAALQAYPDPENIPERNVARLRELGVEGIQARLKED